jgi:hypothetical protein
MASNEVSPEVLEEGCYYLSKLGMSIEEVAKKFEISPAEARAHIESYALKLKMREVEESDFDRTFWEDIKQEAEGNVKVTFLSDKGFHHAWRTDLQKMDGPSLLAIFEASRAFLDSDPSQRFLEYSAPKGYDPLALQRDVKRSLGIISELLEEKWKEDLSTKKRSKSKTSRLQK